MNCRRSNTATYNNVVLVDGSTAATNDVRIAIDFWLNAFGNGANGRVVKQRGTRTAKGFIIIWLANTLNKYSVI